MLRANKKRPDWVPAFAGMAIILLISFSAFADTIIWTHPFNLGEEEAGVKSAPLPPSPPLPAFIHYQPSHKPMIAIVIDDMGVDVKRSARMLELPPGVTMAFLPYARKITEQVAMAKAKGHEVILHMPMQARSPKANAGPHVLKDDMTSAQLEENILAALDSFTGYVGVNNHEGSKFTAHKAGLDVFMAALEKRGLFFLDSRTSPKSVAEQVAREHHLKATHRDVFIDHIETEAFAAAALAHAEEVALRTGSAIAIGHPKDVTISALKEWLTTLDVRGFDLVPLSTVVEYRNKGTPAIAK